MHLRHRKRRRPGSRRRLQRTPWPYVAVFVLSALLLGLCLFKLLSYAFDYVRSQRVSAELRRAYMDDIGDGTALDISGIYADAPLDLDSLYAEAPTAQEGETEWATDAAVPEAATVVAVGPAQIEAADAPLPAIPYPLNPNRTINSRFQKIRRQNNEIIGWLTLGDLLSEAVVQRDNSYYLRRDYQGYHNVNGAIFLEEHVDLSTRPYTLTLYGHNMKTGAMFGCLRNYEDIGYYRKSPFITFDTIYEEGRYVIFSIAEVSLDSRYGNYNGFFRLNTCSTAERKEIIDGLFRFSKYVCPIDVSVDDQLLLLVTCVGDDSERRVVAARRFRDGETEGGLYVQAQKAHSI